jgi:hypothetical protein
MLELIAGGVALLATLLNIVLHAAVIQGMIHRFSRRRVSLRTTLLGVPILMGLHIVQVAVYAAGIWLLHAVYGEKAGTLSIGFPHDLETLWYFSACVFSTVGFGEIVPTGPLRFYVGIEAIAGLLLIAWSASYTFIVLQRSWANRRADLGLTDPPPDSIPDPSPAPTLGPTSEVADPNP